MKVIALSLSVFVLAAQMSFAQESNSEWKVYDASALLQTLVDSPEGAIWGSHVLSDENSSVEKRRSHFLASRETTPLLRADELVSLLRNGTAPEMWNQEEVFADVQDKNLVVRAPSKLQKEIEKALHQIEGSFANYEIEISIDFIKALSGKKLPGKMVWNRKEVNDFKNLIGKEYELEWHAEGNVFSGFSFSTGLREKSGFVRSYNVEVATKSKGVQPNIAQTISGPAISIRPYVLSSGQIHLNVMGENAKLKGIANFDTKAADFGPIQIPQIGLATLAANATLNRDEVLFLSLEENSEEKGILISCRTKSENRTENFLEFLDTRFLLDRSGRELLPLSFQLEPGEGGFSQEAEPAISVDFFSQLFRGTSARNSERSGWTRVLGGLYIFKTGAFSNSSSASFQSLQNNYLPSFAFELSCYETNGAGTAQKEAVPVSRAKFSGSMHRSCGALLGNESSYLSDYQVQIAQESMIAQPVVNPLFRGYVARIQPLSLTDKTLRVMIDLKSNTVRSEKVFQSGLQSAGNLNQVEQSSASITRVIELEIGKNTWLGEAQKETTKSQYFTLKVSPLRD